MSVYLRPKLRGTPVIFTICLARRNDTLLVDEIDILRARRPFVIDAWVILPDHMHAMWTLVGNDSNFSDHWVHHIRDEAVYLRMCGIAASIR
jgi:putative transposase